MGLVRVWLARLHVKLLCRDGRGRAQLLLFDLCISCLPQASASSPDLWVHGHGWALHVLFTVAIPSHNSSCWHIRVTDVTWTHTFPSRLWHPLGLCQLPGVLELYPRWWGPWLKLENYSKIKRLGKSLLKTYFNILLTPQTGKGQNSLAGFNYKLIHFFFWGGVIVERKSTLWQ